MAKIFEQTTLTELSDSVSTEAFPHIICAFLDELDLQIKSLHVAAEIKDIDQMSDLAHTIKSTAATFGAELLSQAALALEQAARDGQVDQLAAHVNTLEKCATDTRPFYMPYTE